MIAVVAAVIGTVTTIAFRTYLYGQLDSQLSAVAMRAVGPPVAGDAGVPMEMRSKGPLDFVIGGGTPMGTVGALLDDGGAVAKAFRSAEPGTAEGLGPQQSPLTEVQAKALAAVPRDGEAHTVELPDLGHYRVEYETGGQGSFLVGIPTRDVQAALSTLVVVEVCVAAVWSYVLLGRSTDYLPWLRWAVLIGGLVAAAGLLLVGRVGRQLALLVVGLGLVASLAGPLAYSLTTVSEGHTGSIVTAGPAVADGRGGPSGGDGGRLPADARPAGRSR